jgi:CHAT domain-containing protein/tetratricopeptide (TPR) repeat protein
MSLVGELLEARDLASVRRFVAVREPAELRDAVEPLAAEVLRMMRTDTRRALDIAERAGVVAEAVGDPRLRARAAWMRAHGLSGVLRNREASVSYEAAASAYRKLGDRLQESKVSIGWINALMYLGEYPKAVALGEHAREVFRRRGLRAEAARLSMNLGNIQHRLDRPTRALREYDRALATARALADPLMIRIIQFNRANVLTSLGRLSEAENLYGEVGREASAVLETRTAGFAEYSLGYLALLRGEYGRAYQRLEAARAVFEDLDDAHYLTLTLADLTELFVEINAFQRAKAVGQTARAMAEQNNLRFEAARCALLEGIACLGLDELAGAGLCLQDARRAFRRERNRVSEAICALYLAELDVRGGRLGNAVRRLRAAAGVFAAEKLPLREAAANVRLAAVESERGRRDRRAIASARRALRRAHSPWLRAQLEHLHGRLALRDRRFDLAVRFLRRAARGIEGMRGRIGIDEFRISFAADKAPIYADLVHAILLRGGRNAVADAFHVVERARSRALVDLLAGRLGGADAEEDPAVAKLLARLERLRAELNWLSGFDPEGRKGRRDETRLVRSGSRLRRCEEEIADVIHRLQAKSAPLGALTVGETTELEDVRRSLGDAALVEYYLSRHGSFAFVVGGGEERVVELDASSDEISDMMGSLRFQIEKWGYGDEYVRARADTLRRSLDAQLRRLAERVWDPLHIEARRVVVVPHGPLHSLPFPALIDADGNALLDRHVFCWLPSASAQRFLGRRSARASRGFAGARVLTVGLSERSIPAVEEEVAQVRRLFRRGTMLRGARATRRHFLDQAGRADVIHVATHSVFREDDPFFSALRLSDGWMSLYDLYGMRLDADMVCLSACQSGRSWVGAGDELVGLARGFLHAGARTVVVSLWPVHDDSTARLMLAFYRRLRCGEPAEEALRAAMGEIRETLSHPYHWAPFILVGAGGRVAGGDGRGRRGGRDSGLESARPGNV